MERLIPAVRSLWFRVPVTLGLLAAIATQIDWMAAGHRLQHGRVAWFVVAVVLMLFSQFIGAARWQLLLRGAGIEATSFQVLRAYLIGLFSNNFLPSSFGGDVARAWIVGRTGARFVRVMTSVVVDRATSLLCLIAVGWLALPANTPAVPGSLVAVLGAATAAGVLAASLLFWVAVRPAGARARRLPPRVQGWARDVREPLRLYVRAPFYLSAASLLGLVFQVLSVAAVWAEARAIKLDLPFSLLAVAAPLVLVITLVPISIAGFGVREGGMVLVLGAASVSTTNATLLSLIGVAVVVVSTLPGAATMLLPGPQPPAASEVTALSGLQ